MIVCRHSMNCGTHYPDLLNISTERAVGAGNDVRGWSLVSHKKEAEGA